MTVSLTTLSQVAVSMLLFTPALGQTVVGSTYNKPSAGPPASYFAAATTMPVAAIQSAVAKASVVPKSATYAVNQDSDSPTATIHGDWAALSTGAAYVFVADMDVDCDGIDYQCTGNQDGQDQTNWGALAAYEVPWIVVPDHFSTYYESALPGNNLAAVICNGNMYYGIFGDSNGDSPEVIGEASWLMARTCFPDDNLNGNSGHVPADVTYIVFTGADAVLPSSALGNNYLTDFTKLRSMGDSLVNALVSGMGLSSSSSSSSSSSTTTTTTTATTLKTTTTTQATTTTQQTSTTTSTGATSTSTVTSCAWDGHCAGATCSTNDDCSDPWSCVSGICNYDPTAVCQWDGHCLDAACTTNDDCSDPWACISGVCAVDPSVTCSWTGHCAGATCVIDDDCSDPYSCIYGVCA